MPWNNGEHDDDVTETEPVGVVLQRLADHLYGVAASLRHAVGAIEALRGTEREYLATALAAQAVELANAARDLAPALRSLAR
jgi:hypothetical protein